MAGPPGQPGNGATTLAPVTDPGGGLGVEVSRRQVGQQALERDDRRRQILALRGHQRPGDRIVETERARRHPTERAQVSAGAYLPPQVVGQRPHIEPGGHAQPQPGLGAVDAEERRIVNLDLHRRRDDGRVAAGEAVRGLAADLLGRVGRRCLRRAAEQRRDQRGERLGGGCVPGLRRGLAGGIVGVGHAPEDDRRLVQSSRRRS